VWVCRNTLLRVLGLSQTLKNIITDLKYYIQPTVATTFIANLTFIHLMLKRICTENRLEWAGLGQNATSRQRDVKPRSNYTSHRPNSIRGKLLRKLLFSLPTFVLRTTWRPPCNNFSCRGTTQTVLLINHCLNSETSPGSTKVL